MKKYFDDLGKVLSQIQATKEGKAIDYGQAAQEAVDYLRCNLSNNKVFFVGNGGSASIASHAVVDFLRNDGIAAVNFNDPSLLTCYANDFGYEYVYSKPLEIVALKGDVLVAISSSGKSKNILNAVDAAVKKGCFVITLSGFSKDNPLREKGNINFYVPSVSYGFVELAHSIICHYVADELGAKKNG